MAIPASVVPTEVDISINTRNNSANDTPTSINVNQLPADNHNVILAKDYDACFSDAELQSNAATQRDELNLIPTQMICETHNPCIMEVDSQPVESKPSDAELNVEPSHIEIRFEAVDTENNSRNNLPACNPASSDPCLHDQPLFEASTPCFKFDHNRPQSTISSPSIQGQLFDNCRVQAPQILHKQPQHNMVVDDQAVEPKLSAAVISLHQALRCCRSSSN